MANTPPSAASAAPVVCLVGHATHPDGHMALALAAAQVDGQQARQAAGTARPSLGLLYLTEAYAAQAEALLDDARQRWPGLHWVGCSAVGVLASGVEYLQEPALALMLTNLPADQLIPFHGRQPLAAGDRAHTALVHADPATPDLAELLAELAARTTTGYLFGGLASASAHPDGAAKTGAGQGPPQLADGVFRGGLSGLAFGPGVRLLSRVTQGCQPVGPARRITGCDGHVVLTLDGQPALPLLLSDLGLSLDRPQQALRGLRQTLVGLTAAADAAFGRGGQFGADTRVRHLVGIDPTREAIAIAESPERGEQLVFCRRDAEAARRDLVRICAELRDELDDTAGAAPGEDAGPAASAPAPRIAGAVYVSCLGRGGPHFGGASAEALTLQHALGDVPLVGFFAAGEIARHHLYGYTGVLTVFVQA